MKLFFVNVKTGLLLHNLYWIASLVLSVVIISSVLVGTVSTFVMPENEKFVEIPFAVKAVEEANYKDGLEELAFPGIELSIVKEVLSDTEAGETNQESLEERVSLIIEQLQQPVPQATPPGESNEGEIVSNLPTPTESSNQLLPTNTQPINQTSTNTAIATNTSTFTQTVTNTMIPVTGTSTQTHNPTNTPGLSLTPSLTNTATWSPTFTFTPSLSSSPTSTFTFTPTSTFTFTPTFTQSLTPTFTFTPSLTNSPTSTFTFTPTSTFTFTPTFTQSLTPTFTFTPSLTNSPTSTFTFTPTSTFTFTPTLTQSLTPTFTSSPTSTFTFTSTPTYTFTPTWTSTTTSTFTFTPTWTSTVTPTWTFTPTFTPTYTLTPSLTPTSTLTPTPTATIAACNINPGGELIKYMWPPDGSINVPVDVIPVIVFNQSMDPSSLTYGDASHIVICQKVSANSNSCRNGTEVNAILEIRSVVYRNDWVIVHPLQDLQNGILYTMFAGNQIVALPECSAYSKPLGGRIQSNFITVFE